MHVHVEDCDDKAFQSIIPLLRAEDVEEWRLFAGDTPAHLVRSGFKLPAQGAGVLNRIGYDRASGRPLVVWGVSPFNDKPNAPGWVWLVATDEAQRHGVSIHRQLKAEFMQGLVPLYHHLITASWVANETHHIWLRKLGFKQAFVPVPMGIHGAEFIPFQYTREA